VLRGEELKVEVVEGRMEGRGWRAGSGYVG